MLYARGENYDVASRVIFCALVGSAFAMPLKYDNHLLGLVKVPRHSHPWADDVFMDVRLRAELFIRDEIANPALCRLRPPQLAARAKLEEPDRSQESDR